MTTINVECITGMEPRGLAFAASLDVTVSMTDVQRERAIVALAAGLSSEAFASLIEREFADTVNEWRQEGAKNAAEAYFEEMTGAHA
jgi:hypothetical protein